MPDPTELFEAIYHPSRIRILRILDVQPSGFSALKRQLKIGATVTLTTTSRSCARGLIVIIFNLFPIPNYTAPEYRSHTCFPH